MNNRIKATLSLKFEPRDLWVGIYWDLIRDPDGVAYGIKVYLCIVPALPLVLSVWK